MAVLQQDPGAVFAPFCYCVLCSGTLTLAERDCRQELQLSLALGEGRQSLQRICTRKDEDQRGSTCRVFKRTLNVKKRRVQVHLTLLHSHELPNSRDELAWYQRFYQA